MRIPRVVALAVLSLLASAACAAPAGDDDTASADQANTAEAEAARYLPPVVVDLGPLAAAEPRSFDVPAGALGVHISVEGAKIRELVDPLGRKVIEHGLSAPGRSGGLSIRDDLATAQISGDAAPLAPGRYTLLVDGASPRAIVRIARTADGAWHGGVVDVEVYVPEGMTLGDGLAISAATASETPALRERFHRLAANLERLLDVRVGQVSYRDVPATFRVLGAREWSRRGLANEEAAGRATQPGARHVLNVVLTEYIGGLQGKNIVGQSLGIPGAGGVGATGRSAVLFAPQATNTAAYDGDVLTHEVGHFLGLEHTSVPGSVLDPEEHDAYDDTPECRPFTSLYTQGAGCPDRVNLMFIWAGARGGALPEISPTQKRLLVGSPLLRAYKDEAARLQPRR